MIFRNINTVSFDIGGTILFANPSVGEVYAKVMARHGRDINPTALDQSFFEVWKRHHPVPLRDISEAGERARWRQVIDETFADYADGLDMDRLFEDLWEAFTQPENWRWTDDTEPTLRELRRRGYRLAVFSNWDSRLRPLLEETGLAGLFDGLFISCEMGMEKPQDSAFRKVREFFGCQPSEILHIGDSLHHDIEGARQNGWHALQITPGQAAARPDQIPTLGDLLTRLPETAGVGS